MKNILQIAPWVILIAAIFAIGIWYQVFKYHDCMKVGHSKLYCILDIGK